MKKSTNSFANVDSLGRIVIPKHLRVAFGLESGTTLELFTEGETIVMRRYQPGCIFCGSISNLVTKNDKLVCRDCINELQDKA